MSSIPDYDSNNRDEALDPNNMNRATVGVYEMGSTFKGFTAAMALDSGAAKITDSFDATHGLYVGGFTITDFHGKHRWLTVPEIFIYSSNIGAARMALATRPARPARLSEGFGLLDELDTELPEVGAPIVPKMPWAKVHTGDDGVRPRHLRLADADGGRSGGARQWRVHDRSDFPAAHAGAGRRDRAPHPEAGDERLSAPALPAERAEGLRPAGRRAGLCRRRQDRDRRKGRKRPLFRQ